MFRYNCIVSGAVPTVYFVESP